jgi:bifunctional DNA-binding transcriptional regulator/antitoxin component of YhaV-PrlF toxin-antitoxin module
MLIPTISVLWANLFLWPVTGEMWEFHFLCYSSDDELARVAASGGGGRPAAAAGRAGGKGYVSPRWESGTMTVVVEEDRKGRILLPLEIRKRFATRRFKVTAKGDSLVLEPLASVQELKGKYRQIIRSEWSELEEKGEEYVSKGRR